VVSLSSSLAVDAEGALVLLLSLVPRLSLGVEDHHHLVPVHAKHAGVHCSRRRRRCPWGRCGLVSVGGDNDVDFSTMRWKVRWSSFIPAGARRDPSGS
jgi:hypothetical protein